jgi:hypothetical protein
MKISVFLAAWAALILAACDAGPVRQDYQAALPPVPPWWEEVLGSPHWRLEWIGGEGEKETRNLSPGSGALGVSPMQEWIVPVIAWPYWPEKGLGPGVMRPAGALFPWDASGDSINLSWPAGVDAFFWLELTRGASRSSGTPRTPWLFDWQRFRELLQSPLVPEELWLDPWRADWKLIARKTLESGFDRRRIVPAAGSGIVIPSPEASWFSASPFAQAATPGEPLTLNAGAEPETWISSRGILRCTTDARIFIPWPQAPEPGG